MILVEATEEEPAGKLGVIDCRGLGYADVYGW